MQEVIRRARFAVMALGVILLSVPSATAAAVPRSIEAPTRESSDVIRGVVISQQAQRDAGRQYALVETETPGAVEGTRAVGRGAESAGPEAARACVGNGPFCDSTIAPLCLNICPEGDALYTALVRDSCGDPFCDTSFTYIDFSNCPEVRPCPNFHPDWPFVHPDSCDASGKLFWSIHATSICSDCHPVLVLPDGSGNQIACRTLDAKFFDTNGSLCVDQADFIGPNGTCNDYDCNGTVDAVDQGIWSAHFDHCCGPCVGNGPYCDSVYAPVCLNICPAGDEIFKARLLDSCGDPVCDTLGTYIDFSNCPDIIPCPGYHPDWPKVRPDSCNPATGEHYWSIHAGGYCVPCNPVLVITANGAAVPCKTLDANTFDTNGNLCVDQGDFIGPNGTCNDYDCNGTVDAVDQGIWSAHFDHCCGPCLGNGPFCDSTIADICLNVCPIGDVIYKATLRDSCGDAVCDTLGTYIDFSNCPDVVPCPGYHPDWPKVHPDSCNPATGEHYWSIHAGSYCVTCYPALVITTGAGVVVPCKTLRAQFYDTDADLCVTDLDFAVGNLCNDYNCDGAVNAVDQTIWSQHVNHCCQNVPTDTCDFYKSPYKDYAPQGMPDFDEKQDPSWVTANGQWTHDGPAAVANCLWWFDSKFEPNPVDPRPFGVTPPNDGYGLVTAYGNWDDHDTLNVPRLIAELSSWMSTNQPGVGPGTPVDSLVSGTRQYIASRGLAGDYRDTLVAWPSYQYLADEVFRSCDVIMQIGLYERYADGSCCRIGSHYVTAAGACSTQTTICISDPYLDRLEGEPPAGGAHGATVHNDANNISGPHGQIQHDPLPLSPAQIPCLNNGQPVEVATSYPAISLLPNFFGINGGDPTCPVGELTAVIESAYIICPCCVLRGDVNSDNAVNVADLTFLVSYLFQGGPPPACAAEGDVNADGDVNVADLTYLVSYLFQGGPPPIPCP